MDRCHQGRGNFCSVKGHFRLLCERINPTTRTGHWLVNSAFVQRSGRAERFARLADILLLITANKVIGKVAFAAVH